MFDALPTYTTAQAQMAAGGVVAFQLLAQGAAASPAVDSAWLAGLLGALLQSRTPGAPPPPPSLLLDLLHLGSRVLSDSRSSDEDKVRSLLLSYVQQSLSDLAAAATEDVPWPQLLRAALAAGVRPEREVLQRYAASLAQTLYDIVRSKAPSKEQLSGAVRTLAEAVTSALMPALPWAPEGDAGGLLVSVLADQKLLQACSPGQLALLCTYATQSGLGAKATLMWKHVAAEVQARGVAASLSAATGNAAADAAAAADACAVWYALEVAGCSVLAGGLQPQIRTWLGRQLQQAQALDVGGSDARSGGGQHVALVLTALQALQVLWVAHRLDGLALVPQGAWAALHTLLASEEQLQLLLPYQLTQLVELRAAAAAAELPLPPVPGGYTARVLSALQRQAETPTLDARAAAARDARLWSALASARALAYLPAEELEGSWESLWSLSLHYFEESCKTEAATFGGRASSLSAADAAAWVSAIERRRGELGGPGSMLATYELRGVVKTLLAAPAVGLAPSAKGSGSVAGAPGLDLLQILTVSMLPTQCMTNSSPLGVHG